MLHVLIFLLLKSMGFKSAYLCLDSAYALYSVLVEKILLTLKLPPCVQLFSIVVFGSIVNEGYLNLPSGKEMHCIFNRNPNACNYGITMGVLAFLTCLLYLALDVYFPQISSVKDRKKAVLSDVGVSGELPGESAPHGFPDRDGVVTAVYE